MRASPCKDCPDREIGCHGKCERYQEYATKRAAFLEERRKTMNAISATWANVHRIQDKKLKKGEKI